MVAKVYIIHENDDWTAHLTKRLDELGVPYVSWHLASGIVDLSEAPPIGVFYNRMSASSHTRGHHHAPELATAVIDWLETHGRPILNGSQALRFELSKVKQYLALEAAGIKTPHTVAAVGLLSGSSGLSPILGGSVERVAGNPPIASPAASNPAPGISSAERVVAAAQALGTTPFITKHNRAGKGLGVQRFDTVAELASFLADDAKRSDVLDSRDGVVLVQQYIDSPEGAIYRNEFVGGKYIYTVRVETGGNFMLCPADTCRIEAATPSAEAAIPSVGPPSSVSHRSVVEAPPSVELVETTETADPGTFSALFPFDTMRPALREAVTIDLNDYPELQADAHDAAAAVTGQASSGISGGIEIDDGGGMFTIVENPRPDLTAAYERFLAANGIDVAGIEYIVDKDGIAYTYDVNTNTNYNSAAETLAGKFAMLELAQLLKDKLAEIAG